MPAKYARSERKYDRNTGKSWMIHHYIKSLSTDTIFEMLNGGKVKPKHKQKFRNVLQSRGIKIVKRIKEKTTDS